MFIGNYFTSSSLTCPLWMVVGPIAFDVSGIKIIISLKSYRSRSRPGLIVMASFNLLG